jgi:hypothetical protein
MMDHVELYLRRMNHESIYGGYGPQQDAWEYTCRLIVLCQRLRMLRIMMGWAIWRINIMMMSVFAIVYRVRDNCHSGAVARGSMMDERELHSTISKCSRAL